jgi:hypothetical protein
VESLDQVRREFAEKIRATAGLRSETLVRAFASVSREDFVGPGPWKVLRPPEQGKRLTGEVKRRRTPTPLLARRSALSRRSRIRERLGTDLRFRVAEVAPARAAPRLTGAGPSGGCAANSRSQPGRSKPALHS